MRTIRCLMRQLLPRVGVGLMLAGLFGGPASAAEVELFTYQNDWSAQYPWGPQEYRGTREPWRPQDPWGYRRPGLDWGTACPIATPFIKGRSASYGVSASVAAASIIAVNTGANLSEGSIPAFISPVAQ